MCHLSYGTVQFEDMRRANEDFYTVNPLPNLDEETLAKLAAESGMTVEELCKQMNTPHIGLKGAKLLRGAMDLAVLG